MNSLPNETLPSTFISTETYIVSVIASAILVLFAIIQPGLPDGRRTFGDKTYSSVEGVFFLWAFLVVAVGVFGRVFAVALDIAAGLRNSEILTIDTMSTLMTAAMMAAAAAATIQWARLRAAFRNEQRRSA